MLLADHISLILNNYVTNMGIDVLFNVYIERTVATLFFYKCTSVGNTFDCAGLGEKVIRLFTLLDPISSALQFCTTDFFVS